MMKAIVVTGITWLFTVSASAQVCNRAAPCDRPHAQPGCANQAACECVCGLDPFCCAVAWDVLCVQEIPWCGICGPGNLNNCNQEHDTPGCRNRECCVAICDRIDPYCCEVAWDGFCAAQSQSSCSNLCEKDGTTCIFPPLIELHQQGAGISHACGPSALPPLPEVCDEGLGLNLTYDRWYRYVPACTGRITLDTCQGAQYDTRMAVYVGSCSQLTLLACSDNAPDCGLRGARIELSVTAGQTYIVRIGAAGPTAGHAILTVTGCPIGADFNADGVVDGIDLGVLLLNWTLQPGAPACGGATPCLPDLNHDASVNGLDLGILLIQWTEPMSFEQLR